MNTGPVLTISGTNGVDHLSPRMLSLLNDKPASGRDDVIRERYAMDTINGNGKIAMDMSDTRSDKGHQRPWKRALLNFTDNTTLHGVRFIFMENSFCLRRILWLLLFLVCSVLMSVQIIERIVFFYDYPMTVNVHVNYNKTLAFPAITLCNQNVFRATAASDRGYYRLLEAMYDGNATSVNTSVLRHHQAQDLTLEEIYLATTHKKEDLIAACEWQDQKCGPENFTEVLTDHGVCYSFNHEESHPLMVIATGSDYGLKLTLNVEQYEYMPGPHNSAGIKVLLHDQKEFPKVAELGLAIPSGSHTFVGIQLLRIQNLPEPHGTCRSKQSPYYKQYTPDACQLACTTVYLEEMCHCRHFYMPHINGTPAVCTLDEYYSCYTQHIAIDGEEPKQKDLDAFYGVGVRDYALGSVKARVRNACDCPVPCEFLIYDPTISFASTSTYATDYLLATTGTDTLKQKYHRAMETTARMDRRKFNAFKDLETELRRRFDQVEEALSEGVLKMMTSQKKALEDIYAGMKRLMDNKLHLLSWQEFHVKKNFMRAREAMEERTLSFLVLGFQEYSYQIEARISQMAMGNNSESSFSDEVRTGLYLNVMNLLDGRIDLADRAYQNYSQLYSAYADATPIFRYRYESETYDDSLLITPRYLLNKTLTHNSLAAKYCGRLGDDIMSFKEALMNYSRLTNESFTKYEANPESLYLANVRFLYYGRRFNHAKSVFYSECIEYPQKILSKRIEELNRRWHVFEDHYFSMFNKVDQLLDDLNRTQMTTLESLKGALRESYDFTVNQNVTKLKLAEDLTSDGTFENISSLRNVFSKFRTRGQAVYDDWAFLTSSAVQIWEVLLDDEDLEYYYDIKGMDEMLRNYSVVAPEVRENFTRIRDDSDFRYLLGNRDSLFFMSLEKIIVHLKSFLDISRLDTRFIQENFLQLDVYYREKSYEQITQQRAYDMFALLCDIGGSMGLFVGASALTICEILDFGLHHSLYRLYRFLRA